jgi:hypothetical protein
MGMSRSRQVSRLVIPLEMPPRACCSRYTEAAGSVPASSRNARCRRPSGSPTGAGMRGYQFNKVEMFQFTAPGRPRPR